MRCGSASEILLQSQNGLDCMIQDGGIAFAFLLQLADLPQYVPQAAVLRVKRLVTAPFADARLERPGLAAMFAALAGGASRCGRRRELTQHGCGEHPYAMPHHGDHSQDHTQVDENDQQVGHGRLPICDGVPHDGPM